MSESCSFWIFQAKDWLNALILIVTCFAVYFGPIRAVSVAQKLDLGRERLRRQQEVFRVLMRTRRTAMHPEKIGALNTIQVDFHENIDVLDQFTRYVTFLYRPAPKTQAEARPYNQESDDLFYALLKSMSDTLGYRFDKRDLERHSYMPTGIINEEQEQQRARAMLLQVLSGTRSWPVVIRPPNPSESAFGKFPPPPGT